MKAIFIPFLIVFLVPSGVCSDFEVYQSDKYLVVDISKKTDDLGTTYYLESRKSAVSEWEQLGAFVSPRDFDEFKERYLNFKRSFPTMNWLDAGEEDLIKIWEAKKGETDFKEMYPLQDRIVYMALGLSWVIVNSDGAQYGEFRILDSERKVLIVKKNSNANVNWPEIYLTNYDISLPTPKAEWLTTFHRNIQGFKVYRSIEFQNDFVEIDALKVPLISNDSLILIMKDTIRYEPGIYEYHIRLVDIAGIEGPPSPSVRLPKLTDLSIPIPTYLKAKEIKNTKQIELSWQIYQADRLSYIEVERRTEEEDWIKLATLPPTDTGYVDQVTLVGEMYTYRLIMGDQVLAVPHESIEFYAMNRKQSEAVALVLMGASPVSGAIDVSAKIDHSLHLRGFYFARCQNFQEKMEIVSPFFNYSPGDSIVIWKDTVGVFDANTPYGYSLILVSDSYNYSTARDTVYVWPEVKIEMPTPIIFINSILDDGKWRIAWELDIYKDIPIRHFVLIPLSGKENLLENEALIIGPEKNFIDLETSVSYTSFVLKAIHWMGKDEVVSDVIPKPQTPPKTSNESLQIWAVIKENKPLLRWPENKDMPIQSYHVYRQLDSEPDRKLIGTLSQQDGTSFLDNTLPASSSCLYWVEIILDDGTSYQISESFYFSALN